MTEIRDPLIRSLQILIIVVVLTACSFISDEIEEQDIVGVWIENHRNCEEELSDCARIEFINEGHFTATNIPIEYFGYFPVSSEVRFDAYGEWKIEESSNPLGHNKIELLIASVSYTDQLSYYDTLYIERKKGNYILYEWHGDPSHRITFIKLYEEDGEN